MRNPKVKIPPVSPCETCGHSVREHKKQGTDAAECWGGTRTNPCDCPAYAPERKLL